MMSASMSFRVAMVGVALSVTSACTINFSYDSNPRPVPTAAIEVKGTGLTETRDCGNRTVAIDGSRSVVTLTGSCPSVAVWGAGHRVTIEAVDRIETAGSAHRIIYQGGVQRTQPEFHLTGQDIEVLQASARP